MYVANFVNIRFFCFQFPILLGFAVRRYTGCGRRVSLNLRFSVVVVLRLKMALACQKDSYLKTVAFS